MSRHTRQAQKEQPPLMERLKHILPKWARYDEESDFIVVSADTVYTKILEALEVEEITKYWTAVCRRCTTTFLLKRLGHPIKVRIEGSKEKWGKGIPDGEGAGAGSDSFMKYYKQATKDL